MLLSDYFLKRYVKDQYERMSMMPPAEKEPEPRYSKDTMTDTERKYFREQKEKLEERLGIKPKSFIETLSEKQDVITQTQTQSKGKSMSIK